MKNDQKNSFLFNLNYLNAIKIVLEEKILQHYEAILFRQWITLFTIFFKTTQIPRDFFFLEVNKYNFF